MKKILDYENVHWISIVSDNNEKMKNTINFASNYPITTEYIIRGKFRFNVKKTWLMQLIEIQTFNKLFSIAFFALYFIILISKFYIFYFIISSFHILSFYNKMKFKKIFYRKNCFCCSKQHCVSWNYYQNFYQIFIISDNGEQIKRIK